MKNNEFGTRLRDLRKKAGLSQRELADRIGVNFSYLSKIESRVMPPPSEQVIHRLAEVLDTDRDELLLLAGKIPADIAQMLKNQEVVKSLRSGKRIKKIRAAHRNEGMIKMKNLMKWKTLTRAALPLMLVVAVAASLWYAAPLPVKALTITHTVPATGTLGSSYTFTVKVNVETQDLLPVHSIDLLIRNKANPGTYTASAITLPIPGTGLTSDSKSFTPAQTNGGAISATASTAYGWTWISGSRSGYGYMDPGGMGYHNMGATWGYGYGYDSQQGNTSITYTIVWTPPSNWPAGSYDVITYVYGDAAKTKKWSGTSSTFTLSVAAAPTPISFPVVIQPGMIDVSTVVSSTGRFKQDVEIESADGKIKLNIDEGTVGKIKNGDPISKITVQEVADPPPPPADVTIIGLTYEFGPAGATFNPPIDMIFEYDLASLPEGVSEEDLVIAYWDEAAGEWVELPTTVDPVTGTLTAKVAHFSKYTVLAKAELAPEEPVVEPEEPAVEPEEPAVEPEEPAVEPEEPAVEKPEVEEPVKPAAPVAPAPSGLAWWVWLLIGIGAVAVIGAVVWVMRRRTA